MKDQRIEKQLLTSLLIASALFLWLGVKSKRAPSLEAETTPRTATATPEATAEHDAPVASVPHQPARPAPASVAVLTDPAQAPVWTVSFGDEFWRREGSDEAATPGSTTTAVLLLPSFNLGDVIGRVRHALQPDAQTGAPTVNAATYQARFDGETLRFSPYQPGVELPAASVDADSATRKESRGANPSATASLPAPDPATEFSFRTLSVRRDGEVCFDGHRETPEWSAIGNTAQALLSPTWGLVEHFEAGAEGVAVTWVLRHALPGAGPLEVVAEAGGLAYAGQTPEGHHFADAAGTARVRVGRAFAVDAAGTRWELAVNAGPEQDGRLFVELSADILAEASYPLAIDPVIGPEFGVNKPVFNPAAGNQATPAVASGSLSFLVVWEDSRNSAATSTDVYGTRVSSAGKILDPLGIAISTAPGIQQTPSVAASGGTFLVAWRDRRNPGPGDIYGTRVSSSGTVLEPLGFAISVASAGQFAPAVAAGPPGFLVAWDDDRTTAQTGADIYAARVTTAGVLLDSAGIAVCTNTADQLNATVATIAGGFFVAWQDQRNAAATGADIFGARVTGAGVVQDAFGIGISTVTANQTVPSAAANSSGILVAWQDARNNASTGADIFAARVTLAGAVLDPTGIPITTNITGQTTPVLAANASGFLVAWADSRNNAVSGTDIFAARVSNAGAVLELNGLPICTVTNNQTAPAVAANSAGFLVGWTDSRNTAVTGNDIFAARISNAGLVLNTNGFAASLAGARQAAPAVAFNGTNYLVAWQDERNFTTNSTDILATRVTAVGKVLDPAGIGVSTALAAQRNPAVAASGSDFLVVWEDDRNLGPTGTDIFGARVNSAGIVADQGGLAVSTANGNQTTPVVAGNDSTFLVAWRDGRNASTDIFGTRVSRGGTVSNPAGFGISTTADVQTAPAIAALSNEFLVVWQDDRNAGPNSEDIYGGRVDNNGAVLDGSGFAICDNANTQLLPAVAALDGNFVVVWQDDRNAGETGEDIYAGTVAGDGSVPNSDGFLVCALPFDQFNPAVAAGRDEFVILWQSDNANGVASDLASTRVSANGTLLDSWPVPLPGSADAGAPVLAFGAGDRFLAVSSAFRNNSTRLALDSFTADPPPTALTVQFKAAAYAATEAGKFAKVTVTLVGKNPGVVAVEFATSDMTATAGADYMPLSGRLVFTGSKKAITLAVPILEDTFVEPAEFVTLTLRNPTGGAQLGLRHTVTLTILDDDF
jgi:hypothetical protein